MAEEYERRGVLGEDGDLGEGGEVRERGLFGGHHGRRSEYRDEASAYAAELDGRRPGLPYEPVYERPGAMAYGEPGYGRPYEGEPRYGRPGAMSYGEPGYGARRPEVVYVDGGAGGYGRRPEFYDAPVGEASDLGTGLIDSNIRTEPDYGSSLTRPDMAGVPIGAYERRGHHGHHDGYTEEEFDEERRHKRYAEAAAAAALGYGLHERHEKHDLEQRLEELGYDSEGRPRRREHHGLFRSDS